MITTLCLLFLIYSILKRPVGWLAKKLETVDWKSLSQDAWEKIVLYSKKGGRSVCRPILQLYYGMIEGDFTVLDKVLIYAGIIYVVVPGDLLPRKILGFLGILDDTCVLIWLFKKLGDGIGPDIVIKVERILDDWFGPEIVTAFVADLSKK